MEEEEAAPAQTSAGLLALREASEQLGIDFPALVATVVLWASPEVHRQHVTESNPTGAVRPDVRRARLGSGERPGDVVDGIRLDRNNYAGQALRAALRLPKAGLVGYQACHVWPETCYDARYHTVLANLVLVPAPIVSLTDHDPDVIAALQHRSFELYGFHPQECPAPLRPTGYPSLWKPPVATPEKRPARETSPPTPPRHVSAVRAGTQRDVILRLWRAHGGNREAVIEGWVLAVRNGEIERRSNGRGQSDEEYAKRLLYDGEKRGWLQGG